MRNEIDNFKALKVDAISNNLIQINDIAIIDIDVKGVE